MKTIETGNLGENIACRFLEKKGYVVIERNYRMKFGEIDIVATKEGVVHFVEVKSVTREIRNQVSREIDDYMPEENVDERKLRKIRRTAEYFMNEHSNYSECTITVVSVILDLGARKARCKLIENVL